ncbi:MAG: c-type cytochrome [Gemmataceae bacterium]
MALPILTGLWTHDEDARDPHTPLLTWWALEAKAESDRDAVLRLFADGALWKHPIVEEAILERLMQRWAMAGGKDNLLACAKLLELAPAPKLAGRLLVGLENGFAGRAAGAVPDALRDAVSRAWDGGARATSVTLGLRLGHRPSLDRALSLITDEKADRATRLACLRILGEIDQPHSVPALLQVMRASPSGPARQEAITALTRYADPKVGQAVLDLYPAKLPEADGVRAAAHNLLASRPAWAKQFLAAVEAGQVAARAVPLDVVHRLALHKDAEVNRLVAKHWGRVRATPQEKQREMVRVGKVLKAGTGDASAGKKVFADTCGRCHKLYGAGGDVGPELTGYERTNALYWIENVIDPSAAIREEYMTFVVQTADGRTLTGIVAGQDKTTVSLKDQEGRVTRLDRARIDDLRASPQSLMPEDQLRPLKDQQVRDLFAYLMSKVPPR